MTTPPSSTSDEALRSDTFSDSTSTDWSFRSSTGLDTSLLLGPNNARKSLRLSDIRNSTRESGGSLQVRPLPRASQTRRSSSSQKLDSSTRSAGSFIYEPRSGKSHQKSEADLRADIPRANLKPTKQLHGREEEISRLYDAILRIDDDKSRVVLVSGASGTGKTALVNEILESKKGSKDGFPLCIQGKFDFSQRQVPYAGITQALRQLCEHYKSKNSIAEQQQLELKQALGTSVDAVKQLLPDLGDLVGLDEQQEQPRDDLLNQGSITNEKTAETTSVSHLTEASQRFRFGIQNFLWAVATWNSPQPIVMFLDDLQFADLESFRLLEALMDMNAPKEARLLLVGCYRDDEKTTMLTNWMEGLEKEEEGNITRIPLSNFSVKATNGFIADVLRMDIDDDKTLIEELASVVHAKTLGNPFFVMEFLKSLQQSGILSFNIMKLSWSWDKTLLQEETEATDNVIDYMKRQMSSLPKDLCDFLPFAACLGSTFSPQHLDTVFTACKAEGIGWNVTTAHWLESCVGLGFISPLDNDPLYRWAHDKVQEAAFSLLPPEELKSVQFHVGEILLENLTPIEARENILAVANLLIKGLTKRSDMDEPKCLEIAKVCLEAGHTLMISAAFSEAVIYLVAGIQFLPKNHWKIDRVLSLELYTSAAESESCAGDGDRIQQYCDEVINQKGTSLTEKFRAYDVLITFMWGKKNDYQGASDMAVHVLTELGCKLPKRMQLFHVLSGIIKMKRTMKKFGPDAILSHKGMTEYLKVQSMVMLDRLVTVAYQLKSPYLPLAILKSFNWSIKYGISEYSPSAFALVALVLMAQLKDFELSRTWANYAVNLIQSRKEYEVARSRTLFVTHGFVLHASLPYQKCAKRLLEGYKSGMSTGDTENACWNAYVYCDILFYTGKNLLRLSEDWEVFTNQMSSLRKMQPCNQSKHLWQVAQNLMGLSDDSFVLKGKAYSFDESEFGLMEISTVVSVYNSLVYLAYFMCDEVNGADRVLELYKKYTEEQMDPGTFINDSFQAHAAVLCYSAARKSKKKKYISLGKKCHKHVQTIGKKGNPNLTHMEKLLDAEFAALKGRKGVAQSNYEAAITLAARKGLVSEQAVINERYGDFMFESLIDYNDASYRYSHAIKLYEEWGAAVKVKKLQKKLEDLTVSSLSL